MKNRRMLKVALAALLIMLPLVLSGCYVAPNDISTGGNGGDAINFPTYQPATSVPTAAPVISVTNPPAALPTTNPIVSLPTANTSWVITTIAPNATSSTGTGTQPGTVATVTPPVTKAPTATPQGSLKLGSQGDDVRTVQRKLKSLGFYKGSIDGDFGAATETAVKAFQKQYGLTVDGKVGPATLAKLASARTTAKPAATATRRPTATPAYSSNTYLRKGASGSQVRQMQERLITLGYLAGNATGNFDEATEAGVIAFQNRHTSYSDGVAGPSTLKALYSSSARATSTAAAVIGNSLRPGANGKAVRTVQTKLKSLGYYRGTVDGDYGTATVDAVKAFQRANGLTADGVAGASTYNKLFSSDAKKYVARTATPKPTARPTATRRPTATPYRTPTPLPPNVYVRVTTAPSGSYATLRRGYTGTPVERLQTALKNRGYYSGTIDGVYGEGTEAAVKAFQRVSGLNADGVAGPATLRQLYEGNFPSQS